ncbi:MAG TPA: universal stress protein, partial [Acidobacteriota bacterium]|nr:universal stress protein [Acidobacteriota bacterium]
MSTAPDVLNQTGHNLLEQLYRSIYVPVDNSAHSNRAVDLSIELGRTFGATLTGCHVYAARMHDYRFKQMEYTLPEEYLQEQELERQRKIHDSLITMGLELISDCYLEDMGKKCEDADLEFESKMMDGKHSEELLKDIKASGYDLTILGAVGIGKVKDTQIGSVCERVVRYSADCDTWVVKHVPGKKEEERDTILVGIDGSPQSFGALKTALALAKRLGKRVELIGVYDPYLHYAVFKGIVNVLTEKASKVFRFEEQNQLHEEIIDTGLAQIYQSHLQVAQYMARQEGVEASTTLLDGKCFQKVLDHARKTNPWLIVVGRVGVHSAPDEPHLGSNAENLLRLAPCDILFTTRLEHPELDVKADESITWTPEAEERMTRVPEMVRNIARTAILRLAVEKGHSVVSNNLVTEAMERFMPKQTSNTTTSLAEKLAIEHARQNQLAMCRKCGVTAKTPDPVKCSVCGGTDFEVITPEVIQRIAEMEGGVEEETTYDGRKVKWTQEARRTLYAIPDKYQMRRSKARIEKKARLARRDTITLEFAASVIDEETGSSLLPQARETLANAKAQLPSPNDQLTKSEGAGQAAGDENRHYEATATEDAAQNANPSESKVADANTGDAERQTGGAALAGNGHTSAASSAASAEASGPDLSQASQAEARAEYQAPSETSGASEEASSCPFSGVHSDMARPAAPSKQVIAKDEKGNPLLSSYEWSAEATQRILR